MVFGPRKAYSERLLCMYRNAALAVCTLLHHFMTQLLPCPHTPELSCSASQHMTCSGLRALTLDLPVPRSKPGCAVWVFRWSHGGREKKRKKAGVCWAPSVISSLSHAIVQMSCEFFISIYNVRCVAGTSAWTYAFLKLQQLPAHCYSSI